MKKLILAEFLAVVIAVGVFALTFYLTKDVAVAAAAVVVVAAAVVVVAAVAFSAAAAVAAVAFSAAAGAAAVAVVFDKITEELKVEKGLVIISFLVEAGLIGLGFWLITILV